MLWKKTYCLPLPLPPSGGTRRNSYSKLTTIITFKLIMFKDFFCTKYPLKFDLNCLCHFRTILRVLYILFYMQLQNAQYIQIHGARSYKKATCIDIFCTILREIYVIWHKCHMRWHNFHFKRMLITTHVNRLWTKKNTFKITKNE